MVFFTYFLITVLLFLVQSVVVPYLSILHIAPDVLLLWVIYLAVRRGQVVATGAGFLIGLVLDLLSGDDGMLGLSSLAKSLAGFIAGYSYNENKTFQTLGSPQLILITAVASLVHNAVYFFIFLQGSGVGWVDAIVHYGIPDTLYTSAIALLPMFVYARKYVT